MRLACWLILMLCCAPLHAGLEPFDEALLQRYVNGEALLPGVLPTGYEHKFEVGDVQEVEVLDRGIYRTLRFHVVGKVGQEVICEVHNGRGLVFAGQMNNNGEFSKAWAGRSGERPAEVKFRGGQHMQLMLHEALRVPFAPELYNLPALEFREGDKFALGATELTVQYATYRYAGVRYELLRSHGADCWFGPHWQWTAEGVVLYRVTRREKLVTVEPMLDWSKVEPSIPKPGDPNAWTAPKEDWTIMSRPDGSMLIFTYQAQAEYQFLDADLNTTSGLSRIGPYGKRVVDAISPGPLVVPANQTLQLNPPGDPGWVELDLLLQQAARLPISMAVMSGLAASDRGLLALKGCPRLEALDLLSLLNNVTSQGYKAITGMAKLWDLSLTLGPGVDIAEFAPLKDFKQVRKLALRTPDLAGIPVALKGWTSLESLEFTGKDIKGVGALQGLRVLSLVHAEVTRKAADEVATLPLLRRLELHSTNLPVPVIKKLELLEWLTITADEPEEAAFQIEAAATLKALKTLEISVIGLKGQDLSPLSASTVESLIISDGLEQSSDIAAIAKVAKLTSLTLVKLKGLDAAALTGLSGLARLKSLTLLSPILGRPRGPSEILAALAGFTRLEELHLKDCGMVKLGAIGLGNFSKLRVLTLEKVNVDAAVTDELASCPKLETLSLAGSLLAKGAHEKLALMKKLRSLDLRLNFSILKEDMEKLRAALPDCEIQG